MIDICFTLNKAIIIIYHSHAFLVLGDSRLKVESTVAKYVVL